MCGIFSLFSVRELTIDKDRLKKAVHLVSHRGPDNLGFLEFPNAFLGHSRLSIISLYADSNQPFTIDNFSIIYNGEIFNYKELRLELISLGHSFRTKSDTEVILVAFKEWGVSCFNKFNGMWALVIYDSKEKKIICSRDRFGQKPLFYLQKKGAIYFASEFEQLVDFSQKEINYSLIKNYLKEGEYDNRKGDTFFMDIKEFPKAHFAEIDYLHNIITKRYWQYPNVFPKKWNNQVAFEKVLQDSVGIRLRADVPIGILLSGGIDSTIVAALCCERYDAKKITAFNYSSQDRYDESLYAIEIAKKLNLKLEIEKPIEDSLFYKTTLKNIVQRLGRCHSSLAVVTVNLLYAKAKREKIKVVLDGQGADELLAGYEYYFPLLFFKYIVELRFKEIYYLLLDGLRKKLLIKSIVIYIRLVLPSFLKKIARYFYGYEQLFSSKRTPSVERSIFTTEKQKLNKQNSLNKFLIKQHDIGLQNLIYYGDIISMLNSVENRSPFMDHNLIEYVFSHSDTIKIKKGINKYALKKHRLYSLFRKQIERKKIGFISFIKPEIKDQIINEVNNSDILKWDIFSKKMKSFLLSYSIRKLKFERFLFRLYQVHLWNEIFNKKNSAKK